MGGDRDSGFLSSDPIPVQPGVPLAVRAAWQAASFAGIGTYLYANVNAEEMFGGVALTFEVGHLR